MTVRNSVYPSLVKYPEYQDAIEAVVDAAVSYFDGTYSVSDVENALSYVSTYNTWASVMVEVSNQDYVSLDIYIDSSVIISLSVSQTGLPHLPDVSCNEY